ncbi:MAG: hypothetical protein LUQ71_08765 [Methanoregula sp.]|nr:hypothetical protein [Methanoregula sp.]
MIDLRSCSRCGIEAKSDDKFCGSCGAPLEPALTGDTDGLLPQTVPTGSPVVVTGGTRPSRRLVMAGALVILGIIILVAGYSVITGSGIGGKYAATLPVAGTGNGSGDTQTGSYVIVENEEPLPVASAPLIATSAVPTSLITVIPTSAITTKALICPADRLLCNETCVDVKTSAAHCGYCNNACPSGQSCMNGNCMKTCSSGQTACTEGCFDLTSNADHCGTCNNNCPAGLLCSNGQCTAPATPMILPV